MALTAQQFQQLKTHWPLVIQAIHPGITEIPKGQGDTVAELLSTWRGAFPVPTAIEVEDALVNTVLPNIDAQNAALQAAEAERVNVRAAQAQNAIDTLTANIATLDGTPTNAEVVAILRQTLVYQRAIIRALRHII